jgi:mono/diheme cytochrome c family protein
MDLGVLILTLAILGAIAWLTFLVNQSRIRRRREAAPQNLSPYLTDDELETNRLSRVLVAALIATAVLAVVMPVYYLNETGRQAHAAEVFDEIAVERGHEWYLEFQCGNCHGADGGGGAASYIEPRSGIETTWAAPSINDVLYRYSEDEVRYWLVYGRQGSPMPAWGVEGGGPMNSQQIDELIAYLDHIKISQEDALARVDGRVSREITRFETADESVAAVKASIEDDIAALAAAPSQYEVVAPLLEQLDTLLTADGTCTDETAAIIHLPCDSPGPDTDRDGIADDAERRMNTYIEEMLAVAPESDATTILGNIRFDPEQAFTTSEGSTPIPDLDRVDEVVTEFEAIERDLRLTLNNREAILATDLAGLDFVAEAAAERRWILDFDQIAADQFDGNVTEAQRGAALYNAYCARCHTAGYSAGAAFTQETGSGAFGPSLVDGRSVTQFPDIQDHYDFVLNGSVNAQAYGVNGIGRGWMPGFGALLSEYDLMLIIKFERAL